MAWPGIRPVYIPPMALAARIASAVAVLALLAAAPAQADDLVRPPNMDKPPEGYRLTGNQALAIAARAPKALRERRKHPGSYANVFEKSGTRWQVSYYAPGRPAKEIAQVYVSDDTGQVTEVWTGPQVAWTMARGYPGAFGRKINAPWVWIPLALLFVAPFVDPRRPLRMRHLDLAVLMAFGVSVAFFNDANIDVSVPLVYPLLLYLLARMLWIGLRRDRAPDPLRLLVPASWLAVGLLFLIGFRIGLNVTNSNVIDVGYSGVIGADRITHGERLWGNFPDDNQHGDTYGPVTYAAYVPFEAVFPWSGRWDDLPAAHAAAIVFDLLCLGLLFLIGRRLRGPTLGIALAYAWAANPFTLYALNCNVNDALVAALVLAAILAAASPVRRGALIALAGIAKFAPLGLAPLFATHTRGALRYAIGFAAALIPCAVLVIAYGGVHDFYDRTIAFQGSRGAPFSVWGLYGWDVPQAIVQGLAVVLAVAVAFMPRRRDLVGLAALSTAVLIALQLGVTYWFYLYLVWFLGPATIALFGDAEPAQPRHPASYEEELGRLPAPAVAWR
jgi:Glycosyltransferase family 87